MADQQEGWYPDPQGDATKLRYWDGAAWTNKYADASEVAELDSSPEEDPVQKAEAAAKEAYGKGYTPTVEDVQKSQGFNGPAMFSFFGGIIALLFGFLGYLFNPVYIYVSFAIGVIAIIAGTFGRRHKFHRGMATAGLGIGVFIMIALTVMVIISALTTPL